MKRLTALWLAFALRWTGYWLHELCAKVEAWGDIEPIKAGGTE